MKKDIFDLTINDCLDMNYDAFVGILYDSMPRHEVYETLDGHCDVSSMLAMYGSLIWKLSYLKSSIRAICKGRGDNKENIIKYTLDDALKAMDKLYSSLSRRITIEKEEKQVWTNSNTM